MRNRVFRHGAALGLALLCLTGTVLPAQAEGEADQAAALTEAGRLIKDGEALIFGFGPAGQDVGAGVALLQEAVALNDAQAMLSLGGIYLYGSGVARDLAKALELFEMAAALGQPEGLARYGSALMWGEIDAEAAEAYLVRAGELGVASAWSTLAEGAIYGYLGGGKVSRDKYQGYADKALAAGSTRVAILEANRLMWGILTTASGPEAVATLQRAADAGNADAARMLIRLMRDGNRYNVRRDRDRAEAYLESYGPLLGEVEIWGLKITVQAARARDPAAYQAVAEALDTHPDWISDKLGTDLFKANENAAIFVLQRKLLASGHFTGTPDGIADRQTLRAMNAYCADLSPAPACDDSVMRPDVVGALIAR